jgi:hypothetical protein
MTEMTRQHLRNDDKPPKECEGSVKMEALRMYIDGHWLEAVSGLTREVFNPATGKVFAPSTAASRSGRSQ